MTQSSHKNMSPDELQAWFKGFNEALEGRPSKDQWKKLTEAIESMDTHKGPKPRLLPFDDHDRESIPFIPSPAMPRPSPTPDAPWTPTSPIRYEPYCADFGFESSSIEEFDVDTGPLKANEIKDKINNITKY